MPPSIVKLQEKIDSRILRERILIFITALAVLFLLWNFLVQARFDAERRVIQSEMEKITTDRKLLDTQINTIALAAASDPATAKKTEITRLQQQLADVQAQLSGLSQGLIGAEQLPKILEEILLRTSTLTLLKVQTLAATELQLSSVQSPLMPETTPLVGGTGVYKHSVVIHVSGDYFQLVKLLSAIEALQWKFYWESLEYKVSQYPNATIEIHVFTLSSEEGLLGV